MKVSSELPTSDTYHNLSSNVEALRHLAKDEREKEHKKASHYYK
ncbi:hypothetical protein [Staphylococcus haemolyticus]|nr:hypothetical protein [Staphylococcus haemolyticus]